MSQRECAGFNWPGFAVSAGDPDGVSPESVGGAARWAMWCRLIACAPYAAFLVTVPSRAFCASGVGHAASLEASVSVVPECPVRTSRWIRFAALGFPSSMYPCLAEAYSWETDGRLYAIGFWGSSGKALFYYRYRNEAERAARLDRLFEGAVSSAEYKAKRKADRIAAPRGLEVGDVLVSSWGYDQTNVDYYEVTKLVGDKMVEIRMIGAESEETGWLRGRCVPAPGKYIGEPMVKVAKNGVVKVREFASAYKMEPVKNDAGAKVYSSNYWSAYA